jgi:hypothetical protein
MAVTAAVVIMMVVAVVAIIGGGDCGCGDTVGGCGDDCGCGYMTKSGVGLCRWLRWW